MITGMEADTCPVADGVTDVTGETFAGVMDAIYLVTPMASQAMDTVTNTARGLESIFRSGFKMLSHPSLLSWHCCFRKSE